MLAQVEYLLYVLNLSASKTHIIVGPGLLFKGLRNLRLLLEKHYLKSSNSEIVILRSL